MSTKRQCSTKKPCSFNWNSVYLSVSVISPCYYELIYLFVWVWIAEEHENLSIPQPQLTSSIYDKPQGPKIEETRFADFVTKACGDNTHNSFFEWCYVAFTSLIGRTMATFKLYRQNWGTGVFDLRNGKHGNCNVQYCCHFWWELNGTFTVVLIWFDFLLCKLTRTLEVWCLGCCHF